MKKSASTGTGRLRIGNNWNVITIIALSQNNPLKAIAEFLQGMRDAPVPQLNPGFSGDELLERMVKLCLYTEENLR